MIYQFGNIELDIANKIITKERVPVSIEPRLFSLMSFFCENPNRAISRDELISSVWQGRAVSDAAVNRAIAQLRKVIELDTSKPNYIQTVSKVGYKFTAKVDSTHTAELLGTFKQQNSWKHRKAVLFIGSSITLFIFLFITYKQLNAINHRQVSIVTQQPITNSKGLAFNPSFSQGTTSHYYLYKDKSYAHSQIRVLNEQQDYAVTNDSFYYTDVIPLDSATLIASRLDNLNTRNCEIVTIDTNSLKITKRLDCGKSIINHLSYRHSTGEVIYRYREIASQPYSLFSTSLSSQRTKVLSHPTQGGNSPGHISYALSKNENKLALVEYKASSLDELQILNLRTRKLTARLSIPSNLRSLVWVSDNLLLATNTKSIFSIDLLSGNVKEFASNVNFGRLSAKSARTLLTEKSEIYSNILLNNLLSHTATFLTQLEGNIGQFVLANTSEQVVFSSVVGNEQRIHIHKPNFEIIDTHFPDKIKHITNMAWSDDDKNIVASINDHIYLLNLKELEWNKLKTEFQNLHHVSFSNKNSILFSAEAAGNWNLWLFDLASGTKTQLTHNEAYAGKIYQDHVYYTKFSKNGLYAKNLNTDQEQVIIENFPLTKWNEWQLNDGKLLYLKSSQYRARDLITGQDSLVFETKSNGSKQCKFRKKLSEAICINQNSSTSHIWEFDIAVGSAKKR